MLVNIYCKLKHKNKRDINFPIKQKIDPQKTEVKITALVFYGRKRYVEILFKYLFANLKRNGGILNIIKFAIRTKNDTDLKYVDSLIALYPEELCKIDFNNDETYLTSYESVNDDDYVFKIDDDIVFIQNGTFENMFKEYTQINHMFLSANVVNHPRLSDVHSRISAIQPLCKLNQTLICDKDNSMDFNLFCSIDQNWWDKPKCAELAHENFFKNFYDKNLDKYDFGLWDFHFENDFKRYSINFILTMGKYINNLSKYGKIEDELLISSIIPKNTNKHTFAVGKTLVCHFAYFTQRDELSKTNILKRYEDVSRIYFST